MKRISTILLFLLLAASLSGCQLAQGPEGTLIGYCFTEEAIGEPVAAVWENGNPFDGTITEEEQLTFPGVQGLLHCYVPVKTADGWYLWMPFIDEGIKDSSTAFGDGEQPYFNHMEATVYIPRQSGGDYTWYLNPIFLQKDGTILLEPGGDNQCSMDQVGNSSVRSYTREKTTVQCTVWVAEE